MVRQITPRELALKIANEHPLCLLDVRQPWENQTAALADSLLIPLSELPQRFKEITADSNALVVVYCHHGIRSLSAGDFLQRAGFNSVFSLQGGIDAWSCEVDPSLPRY